MRPPREPNGWASRTEKQRYKGVSKQQNGCYLPAGQPQVRILRVDGLPEAEANFRDLHHRLMAIF